MPKVILNPYKFCTVEGCGNLARSKGSPYCEKHYYRLRRNGVLEVIRKAKEKRKHTHGYILIYAPDHPLTLQHTKNYEFEHRIVFYDAYGEGPFTCYWCGNKLTWGIMDIDHLDADKTNNDLDNLVASCPECNRARAIDKVRQINHARSIRIEHNGVTKTLREWAKGLNISSVSLQWRLDHGWSIKDAVTKQRGNAGPLSKRVIAN